MKTHGNIPNFLEGGGSPPPRTADALPKDVTEWVGTTTLIHLVLEAIQQVDKAPGAADFAHNGRRYRPQMLLALLTYAYARGILGSREVESAISTQPAMKYIVAGNAPDWAALRIFRRQNQKRITDALAEVLRMTWQGQHPVASRQSSIEPCYATFALERWLLAEAPPDFAAEAAARVRAAIVADTLMLDE